MNHIFCKLINSRRIDNNSAFNEIGCEFLITIRIKLKNDFCDKKLLYLILFSSIIFIFLLLIILPRFLKSIFFLDVFYDGKIYYKREKNLNLNKIKKQIKTHKNSKIHFDNNKNFIKTNKPLISLIMTLYNQEKYIKYIYCSIQKQELKELELIIIDDASTDNSSNIINNLMKYDKRIIYIQNKINRGSFYSRNGGVLLSKGEFILIIDPDDLLLNNILKKAYEVIKYYHLDILQYYVIRGSYKFNKIWRQNKYTSGILYSKDVKNVFFYSISRTLWDKLIRRNTFIKGIMFMKSKFIKEFYFLHSDDIIFWGIINSAISYGFLEQIGYFYNTANSNSLTHHYYDSELMNKIFHSLFATLKYYYIQSENNEIEKNFVGYKFFTEKINNFYVDKINNLTEGFDYIIDVLNLYIRSPFLNITQKDDLIAYKEHLIKKKNTLKLNNMSKINKPYRF